MVFGKDAVLDMDATVLRWFDYALKGEANEYATGAPVRLFVMGENRWRDEKEFPLARTRSTRYYLRSAKAANTAAGDGTFATRGARRTSRPPGSNTTRPTRCAPSAADSAAAPSRAPGPYDQRPNESRADVLVFSTPPLAQDVEVTGYVRARAVRVDLGGRHRLHGASRRRGPLGVRALPDRRHRARPISRGHRARPS